MTEFHHPYNFIPVTGKIVNKDNKNPSAKIAYVDVKDGKSNHVRHDLWHSEQRSGRIICRLRLETPTVVGAEQIEEDGFASKRVKPYQRGGKLAIPANSLRGMIGSIAEALSQSALRVLEDRYFSVRKSVNDDNAKVLSAIGMLKKSSNPDERWFDLVPLTIPTLRARRGQYQMDEKWRKVFGNAPLAQCLSAYVDGYKEGGTREQPKRAYQKDSFLDKKRPVSFNAKKPAFYYARLVGVPDQTASEPINSNSTGLRETDNRYFLLGQQMKKGDDAILNQEEFDSLDDVAKKGYTKGILRVLGIVDREKEIPSTKKHEMFIPVSKIPRIAVPDDVVERFYRLANERQAESEENLQLPFQLNGYNDWEPDSGQLFFFDVGLDDEGQPFVSEISISAIWRKEVDGKAWDFFRSIDPNALPWNPERKKLTPAELLFGVAEEIKSDEEGSLGEPPQETKPARNLASRLRFHDAMPLSGKKVEIFNHPVTLKILNSPKLPCPSMYFHPRNGGQGQFISKTALNANDHRPNGRKVYLRHPPGSVDWETHNHDPKQEKLKLRCTPLDKGQDFYFPIDFENLSEAELGLLLTSLRPSEEFRHRLGLGKPLGLGTVEVAIEGVFLVNRVARYGLDALNQPRYHAVWRKEPLQQESAWAGLYPEEAGRLSELRSEGKLTWPEGLVDALIDRKTLSLLQTIGVPGKLRPNTPVEPPLMVGQSPEQETFRWFQENERPENRQALQPIQPGQELPTLKKIPPRQ
jgi:CRISPR-associated protein (TIGR03986 family)